MKELVKKIETLLEKNKGLEPQIIGYSTKEKRLFLIPDHTSRGKFDSVINNIYYSNLLATLCGGNIEDVYILKIETSHRYKNLNLYFIDTENKDSALIIIDQFILDWVE